MHVQPWPQWDPELARAETVTLVVSSFGAARRSIDLAVPSMAPVVAPPAPKTRRGAKQAAVTAMQWTASGVASAAANYALEWLPLTEQQRHWLRIGLDAYQIFAYWRAAKLRVRPGDVCFVAGTGVESQDLVVVTDSPEEVRDLVGGADPAAPRLGAGAVARPPTLPCSIYSSSSISSGFPLPQFVPQQR